MQDKMRIVQELVPGRQITIAHIIANPDPVLYQKLGLDPKLDYSHAAIGVLTISPAETAVIIRHLPQSFLADFRRQHLRVRRLLFIPRVLMVWQSYIPTGSL